MSQASISVEFNNISKIYGSCRAVDGVSARFEAGRIHAILGENGAGKSTLMKLLFGLLVPTSGSLCVNGEERRWRSPADAIRAGLGMVQQHFTLVETQSVIDNIMLGDETVSVGGILDREAAIAELEKNLPSKDLYLDWHRPVSDLSVGEKQKVEILKLIARRAKILVLDEPTAVLSPQEIEVLFSILKGLRDQGRTIFVITHKLAEVFSHCDTWFVLRANRAVGSGEIKSTTMGELVRAMIGSDIPPLQERTASKTGATLLKFSNVSIEPAAHPVRNLSFEVQAGEVVGVAGVDGSGQAEVVEALLGLRDFSGCIEVFGETAEKIGTDISSNDPAHVLRELRRRGLALVSEDRHHQSLWLEESVELNAGLGFETENGFVSNGWLRRGVWRERVTSWLKSFDVRFPTLETPIARLSGGNQQKAIFARELLGREPKLIVVHQPTRGVDFAAIRLIHERILECRDRGAAVLVISSELDELMTLSDRMIVMCGGQRTGHFVRTKTGAPFVREEIGRAMTDATNSNAQNVKLAQTVGVREVVL